MRKFIVCVSQLVNGFVKVRGVGFATADSMIGLVAKLQVGNYVDLELEPRGISIYFSECGEEIATLEQLQSAVEKALA
jgi:hypothetical protein